MPCEFHTKSQRSAHALIGMIEGLYLRFLSFERTDKIGAGNDNDFLDGCGQAIERLREDRGTVVQLG
jgi:hypothetical protein